MEKIRLIGEAVTTPDEDCKQVFELQEITREQISNIQENQDILIKGKYFAGGMGCELKDIVYIFPPEKQPEYSWHGKVLVTEAEKIISEKLDTFAREVTQITKNPKQSDSYPEIPDNYAERLEKLKLPLYESSKNSLDDVPQIVRAFNKLIEILKERSK